MDPNETGAHAREREGRPRAVVVDRCILCRRLVEEQNAPTHIERCPALEPHRLAIQWLEFQLRRAPRLAVIETMSGTVGIQSPNQTWAHPDGTWGKAPGAICWAGAVSVARLGADHVVGILDQARPWWPAMPKGSGMRAPGEKKSAFQADWSGVLSREAIAQDGHAHQGQEGGAPWGQP